MNIFKSATLIAAFILTGCVNLTPKAEFSVKNDIYNGSTQFTMRRIETYRCNTNQPDYKTLNLAASAYKTKSGEISYMLGVNYIGSGWMFIDAGYTLEAIINGTPRKFKTVDGSRGSRETLGGSTVGEMAIYEVTRKDLEDIANTQVLQFRVIGSKQIIERCMDPIHREPFKEFLEKTKNL